MTFTPITLGTGVAGYAYLTRTRDTQQALFDRTPLPAREADAAREKLATVQSIDDLMADRMVLKVALGAFGLEEDIDNKAFIRKILESDLSDRQSLANKLSDKRYLSLAQAFNFGGTDGPRLPNTRSSDELTSQLQSLQSADDLLSDPPLLRATLERFDLEANMQNTYFLKQVLNSDLSDPTSFANRMSDNRLIALAETFDFHAKASAQSADQTPVQSLSEIFSDRLADVNSAEDLMATPELLEAALDIFGLDNIYTDTFLTDVLNSDLNDPDSVANSQTDNRFASLAAAFNFATPLLDTNSAPVFDASGAVVMRTGTLERFLQAFDGQSGSFTSADEFLSDRSLREATFDLLGLPQSFSTRSLAQRVLSSDATDPNSFGNLFPDPRYAALSDLVEIRPVQTTRVYPEGFVDQVVRNYLDRQFEITVGEVDPDMRVALSIERELGQVMRTATTNDARWFSIMSSPPLRQAFEGAFRLPSSFGSIDIDQQLLVLKNRAERFYGTSEVAGFLEPDRLDELRQSYLLNRSIQATATTSGASAASILLANL